MNVLAIDTTTKKATVGIKINGTNYIKSIDNEITHSEKLLPLIDEVLKDKNITLQDMDMLACVTGPGSFTGIRIGLSTIKAIAKVISKGIYGCDSVTLLANSITNKEQKVIVSVLDAKNTRGYYGIYENSNQKLTAIKELQNNYITHMLEDIAVICNEKGYSKEDVLVITDSLNILEQIKNTYETVITNLDLNILLDNANTKPAQYNYLTLDATYVRASEAERTKYGE